MRATDFEFRYRFWIIGAIIWCGFGLYVFDHTNVAVAMAAPLARWTGWREELLVRGLFAFGALLTVMAALIRTWACSILRTEIVHAGAVHSERLVADGPYRHVRNPLYLGTTLLTLGMGLMASRAGYAFLVLGVLIFDLRLIGREEAELSESQGASYRDYLQAVPCLVPSPSARVAGGDARPQWKQAFRGEGFFWGLAAATVVFAATLKIVYFWVALAIAMLLYFWGLASVKKGARG